MSASENKLAARSDECGEIHQKGDRIMNDNIYK